jgi:hypothetical protein
MEHCKVCRPEVNNAHYRDEAMRLRIRIKEKSRIRIPIKSENMDPDPHWSDAYSQPYLKL